MHTGLDDRARICGYISYFFCIQIVPCSGHGYWNGYGCQCNNDWVGNVCESKFRVRILNKYYGG